MVRELVAIDPSDRWSRDLARLVRDYRNLAHPSVVALGSSGVQVHRNRLLWKKLPVTVSEAWALEHAMSTESLMPAPAAR